MAYADIRAKPCSCKAALSISLRAVTAITGMVFACGMLEARKSFYQIEAVDSRHLYIRQQDIKNRSAELFDKFFELLAAYCINAVLFQHAAVRLSWILSSSIKRTRITFITGMAVTASSISATSFSDDDLLSMPDSPTG